MPDAAARLRSHLDAAGLGADVVHCPGYAGEVNASEDRLGAQSPPDWHRDAKFYDSSAINAPFGGDAAFVKWRGTFGPRGSCCTAVKSRRSLSGRSTTTWCGVAPVPPPRGWGRVHPIATIKSFGVKTRAELPKLSADDQSKVTADLQQKNSTFGYYGQPPVPADKVLDYPSNGPGKGTWASVEVQVLKNTNQYESMTPAIPFWNRQSNSTFCRTCNPIVLKGSHTPVAPSVP